ncbi:hypothetical protein HDE_07897 [Halotydeus destructor]|nr:hypothetical protein HDE_07897 [Halotydeus destructor]
MGAALKISKTRDTVRHAYSTLGYEAAMCALNFLCLGILIALNHRFNLRTREDLENVAEEFYERMNRRAVDKSGNGQLAEFLEELDVNMMSNISLFSLSDINMNFIAQFGAALVNLFTLINQLYEAKQEIANS